MKSTKNRVIPGFGLSMGIMVTLLGLIVVIPLCSLVVYSAKMSVSDFFNTVTRPRVLASFQVSVLTALAASVVNLFFGLAIAWVLVRYDFPCKKIMDGIIELPFALPTAVAGIALTHLTVSDGWVGKIFAKAGIQIAYTRVGIIVALIFIGIPFVVRSVQPVLEKLDREYEDAASIMGADRKKIFFSVILPEIAPSLFAGFSLAFGRCLGEYGSVVFIAGNMPYKTEIAPLLIMSKLQEYDYSSATAIALVMLAFSFIILFANAVVSGISARIVNGER